MKIFLICSKKFYDRVPPIKVELEKKGHAIVLPNSFEDPTAEERHRNMGMEEHARWKATMLKESVGKIEKIDAVLVLNFEKNGIQNYIGGATFIEMYDAFRLEKKIYLYNEIPEGMLKDEIIGFGSVVLNGNLERIV